MSCQLDVVSAILDVAAIRYRLFPERSLEDDNDRAATVKDDDDWDGGNWSWKEDGDDDVGNNYAHSKPTPPNRFCWLQECVTSVSPVGDVLVLARNRTIIWLNQKWDNDSSRQNFFKVRTEIITSTSDDRVDEQDFVTAVLCLPLASQKRSAHGRQDWTAVLVGFNLGTVRIYTEDGTLLLVQRFDQSPIVSLKCRCFEPPRYNAMAEQHEELVVVYKKSVVVVQGLGLYQTLRACRNQAAKAAAAGGDPFEAPPLEYKKWALHDHNEVNDCESIGTVGTTTFDQMVSESVLRSSSILGAGLMVASRKASPSAASLFVATGICPYVAFYYAVEGSAPLLVSEAMMAAAQKLSSYFTGFFVGGRTQVDKKQPPKLEPATSLPSRFELRDLRRTGLIICASPNRRLSAISDEFGRVVIVDNHEGIAVRVFKGYREAQCGWIEVEEECVLNSPPSQLLKIALFLVIYSRRRGILEVWAAQQGPRVAAFSVGKTSTLVYCNYAILGATNVKSVLNSWSQSTRCYLLDVDGVIRSITVPFHCALSSGGDRSKSRDLHLLEKVRLEVDSWRRNQGGRRGAQVETPSKMADIVLDIKTWTVRQQALELVLKSEDADSVVINEVVSRLLADLEASNGDCETLQRLRRYLQLLRLHDAMVRLVGSSTLTPVENDVDVDVDLQEKPLQALSAMLHLGEPEIDHLLTKVDRYFSVLDRRKRACIHFKDTHGPLSPAVFLNCFDATPTDHLVQEKDDNDSAVVPIHLAPELNKESFASLARFLFEPMLMSERSCSPDFLVVLLESGVVPNQLLSLLIQCWLNLEDGWSAWRSLCNLHAAVIYLSSQSADSVFVNAGYNEVSSWWSSVRSRLRCSSSVAAGLTSAIVCRGASVTLVVGEQLEAIKTNQTTKEGAAETAETAVSASGNEIVCLSDWEGVHLDTEQWSLLVKQLEDLVSLATLVDAPIPEALSSGLTSATVLRPVLMTVDGFLDRGRGGISELVSQWLTRLNLPVLLAVLSSSGSTSRNGINEGGDRVEESATNDSILEPQTDQLRAALEESRLNFPYSLRHDVLLANCSWEFAALWNADKEETKWLDGCLSCLAACSVDAPYRRGLASLLWHTFFAKSFEAAAQLVEKVGKAPKERLCRKSVGMSDTVLEKFLLCCERLLDTLIKVINLAPGVTYDSSPAVLAANATSSLSMSAVNFRCEDPWQDTTGPAPIVDVALETREPNENLIVRHRDLAIVLYAVFAFTLRSCKPLSLYDTRNKVLFFVDLSSAVNQAREPPDLSIVNSRIQFLCRLISAVVQTIPVPSSSGDCSTSSALQPIMSEHANAVVWFGRALNLGSSWQLDTDQLRRHLVCELYSSGLDSMAEEVLPSVVNCEAMGSQLIMIAGRRICQALQTSTVVQKITLFSPAVTAWLKSLEREDLYCPTDDEPHWRSAEITVPLLTYIINAIPEHQSEHNLALNLMEGLQQLLLVKRSTTDEPTTDR